MKKIKKILSTSIVTGALFFSSTSFALNAVEQSYAARLANGGSSSIKSVSSSLVKVKGMDAELYDIAAEVLLRDYKAASDKSSVDALAWVTKALQASGDGRYLSVLQEVSANAGHAKLQKYAKSTGSKLERSKTKDSAAYVKGAVNLSAYKRKPVESSGKASGSVALSDIRVGMSSGEVYSLIGTPTSEQAHVTGRAFIPFNYSGRGNVRTIALYKGQGSIIFENTSAYTAGKRVVEVIADSYEPGFR